MIVLIAAMCCFGVSMNFMLTSYSVGMSRVKSNNLRDWSTMILGLAIAILIWGNQILAKFWPF